MKHNHMMPVAGRLMVLAIVACPLYGFAVTWVGGAGTNWNDAASWNPAGVPEAGADVTIGSDAVVLMTNSTAELSSLELTSGSTLIVNGWQNAIRATNLLVAGTVTHAPTMTAAVDAESNWVPEHRILIEGSNLTVTATGKLDANYMGYRRACGPGSPAPYGGSRSGAGHATDGGYSRNEGYARGGFAYGDPVAPEQPGSGGGSGENSREGGGAIRIILSGQLDLAGKILAQGSDGINTHGSGGSGGSIWITTRTVTGLSSGLITVNGGRGWTWAGGGAAGRIAIDYDPDIQGLLVEPCPPIVFAAAYGAGALPFYEPTFGTLYLPDTLWLTETLDARFSSVQLVIPGFSTWSPQSLTLNGAKISLPAGFQLDITNDLILANSAVLHLTAAPVDDPLTEDGATVNVGGSLQLAKDCWIHPYADPTNGATVAFNVVGDITVAAKAGIDANYKGYNFGFGPGVAPTTSGGSGYGGCGAMGPYGELWGPVYGSVSAPRQPGSGRAKTTDFRESPGGGAIRLAVGGDIVLNGELRADAATEGVAHTSGGSGGGVHVVCRTFQGGAAGLVSANGASGAGSGGSGGGGRIAICYDKAAQALEPVPAVRFSAYAPPAPVAPLIYHATFEAKMGTLYLPDTRWVTEVIDGGRFSSVQLVIPEFSSWAPNSLTISNVIFTLPEGFHLNVVGELTVGPNAKLYVNAVETNESNGAFGAKIDVGGDLSIKGGGWLCPAAQPTNGAIVRIRVAGNVAVAAGGGIDASGLGYHPGQGPGGGGNKASGGSHGGLGGGTLPGICYGRAAWPLEPGSPGGWRATSAPDEGFGGGVILLQAGGAVVVNGTLNAKAKRASYQTGNGPEGAGGSGGSILLLAGGRITGDGILDASGGLGFLNVSGGGGRIAVWPNLPLSDQDALLGGAGGAGVPSSNYAAFSGTLKVDSLAGVNVKEEAGAKGTAGFYIMRGTIIVIH